MISMMGTIGHCSIIPDNIEKGIMDSHLLRISIDEQKYHRAFCKLIIGETALLQRQIKTMSVGSIMNGLSADIIKHLLVPYPPISEQKQIIQYIQSIMSMIICSQKKLAKLELQKQGLMQDLLTNKVSVEPLLRKGGIA